MQFTLASFPTWDVSLITAALICTRFISAYLITSTIAWSTFIHVYKKGEEMVGKPFSTCMLEYAMAHEHWRALINFLYFLSCYTLIVNNSHNLTVTYHGHFPGFWETTYTKSISKYLPPKCPSKPRKERYPIDYEKGKEQESIFTNFVQNRVQGNKLATFLQMSSQEIPSKSE